MVRLTHTALAGIRVGTGSIRGAAARAAIRSIRLAPTAAGTIAHFGILTVTGGRPADGTRRLMVCLADTIRARIWACTRGIRLTPTCRAIWLVRFTSATTRAVAHLRVFAVS